MAPKFEISLAVGNLPSNKLALTNRVYIPSSLYAKLEGVYGNRKTLILINQKHPYLVEGRDDVEEGTIALNGLQRRFAKLSLAANVTVTPLVSPPPATGLQFLVNTLSKPKTNNTGKKEKPTPFDTDRLAPTVLTILEHQALATNQILALDFEGTKLEITVGEVTAVQHKEPVTIPYGQLTSTTVLQFARAPHATHISLTGHAAAAGSAGAPSMFKTDFDFEKLGIGGLDAEFNQIFRRAFSSRIWPASVIAQMGISHVRGMLLYGPPGCGKTLIARQIGKALNAREPKIVNGPEILNKFVGGSEEKIRELFADAEQEQAEEGDASMLHIVIMDEMDAICKQRGSVKDGTGVSDSVVNQLLSKIDGVDSLNNILLIGMTNRKDMIDDALLRPGRLEVHVEIGLPDSAGRLQILNIHTRNMRKAKRVTSEVIEKLPAIAEKTKNFSGAELEGLVKAASSYALTRCVDVKDLSKPPDTSKLRLEYRDFEQALGDVEPKFGAKATELKTYYRNGIINYGSTFEGLKNTLTRLVHQVASSDKTPLLSVLLQGSAGVGKTAIAAQAAVDSGFPFVRMISADEMIGYSESSKCQMIHRVFMDSYKSPLSLILIDDLERIIDYVPTGPRFSNTVLQTLLVLLKKVPPDHNRRLMVIATTSVPHYLEDLGLTQSFGVQQSVPVLDEPKQVARVLKALDVPDSEAVAIAKSIGKGIGIKQLLMVTEMAKQDTDDGKISVPIFLNCLTTVGL